MIEHVTAEDLKEYIESSTKAMAACLEAIAALNRRIIELQEKYENLERIVGNVAVK